MPSLKVSCANAGGAKASVVAATTDNDAKERLSREKRFMIFSPNLPAVRPSVSSAPVAPASAVPVRV